MYIYTCLYVVVALRAKGFQGLVDFPVSTGLDYIRKHSFASEVKVEAPVESSSQR